MTEDSRLEVCPVCGAIGLAERIENHDCPAFLERADRCDTVRASISRTTLRFRQPRAGTRWLSAVDRSDHLLSRL